MIVFAGPSLASVDRSTYPQISFLPPCRQGDVYLAALENPTAIGIIDGYFEGVPSVWHKEILWAMSQGIPVLGASSMGALRAAELDAFGMIGVGIVYQGYQDGTYLDDDEVALLHGPEELGFPPLSLAMVNVRATLKRAISAGMLTEQDENDLLIKAKACFYKNRNWNNIVKQISEKGFDSDELLKWLEGNCVDQKQLDAIELLETLQKQDFSDPPGAGFEFEVTNFWHRNTRKWHQRGLSKTEETSDTGYRLFGKNEL